MKAILTLNIALLATVIGGCNPVKQGATYGASSSVSSVKIKTGSDKNLNIVRATAKKSGSELFYQIIVSESGKVVKSESHLFGNEDVEIKVTRGKSYLVKFALGALLGNEFVGYVDNKKGDEFKPVKAKESLAMTLVPTDEGRRAGVAVSIPSFDIVGSYKLDCTEIYTSGYYQSGSIVLTESEVTSVVEVFKYSGCSSERISIQKGTSSYTEKSETLAENREFELNVVNQSTLEFFNEDDASSFKYCGKENWLVNEEVNLLALKNCDKQISDISTEGFKINFDETTGLVKLDTGTNTYLKITE